LSLVGLWGVKAPWRLERWSTSFILLFQDLFASW
jgi:hypothetical protein